MELEARKAVLYSIFDAGVRAVAPDAALMRHVRLEGDALLVDGNRWPLPRRGRLLVLGAGKGVAPMGAAVELAGDLTQLFRRGRPYGRCRGRAAGGPYR